jgi:hypothetical protein
MLFENIILTYVHAATGRETAISLLVASNKMSSWPSAWISSAPTGWIVVKVIGDLV